MEKSKLVNKSKREEKGFGMRMLEKFGWDKGSGLGKIGQGIVDPIEVNVRPKNMGLGFDEYKVDPPNVVHESMLEEPTCSEPKEEKLWLKQGGRSKKRKKDYLTAEELPVVKKQERGLTVVEKVLDMRGPQVRVLTNLKNLNDIPMPEIRHNLSNNVDLAELHVLKIDWDLRYEKEYVITLHKEKEKLGDDAARQKQELDRLYQIVSEMERLDKEGHLGLLTLESLAKSFGNLQKVYLEEYKFYNLSKVACFFAFPLFDRVFQGCDPLAKPTDHFSVVSVWKELLAGDEICDSLFMEVVFPTLRMSFTNTWQVKQPEPLLWFLDYWQEILPHSALETLLDHIVMPKLSAAVDSWDPRQDTIPIHVWVHPWLPFLGQKLEACLYPTIRIKLERVLRDWRPSDASAYTLLSPWKPVFDRGNWEKIMVRYIVPKLLDAMQIFRINPADQKLDQFYLVQTWTSLIPIHHMLHIMDVFFQKWHEALYQWLLCSKTNYQEVVNWFVGWKKLIPDELLSNEYIRCQLKVSLDMMDQAADGLEVGPPEKLGYKNAACNHQQVSASFDASFQMNNDMTLKEVIEAYAQDNNLVYKPKPGRTQDGQQVYGFGNISIIIDCLNQKVFAQTEGRWSAVTLDQLVMMEKALCSK